MVLNELLAKQNILNALLIKEGENELSKELKVKIVRLRIAYNNIRKQFNEDLQEFTKNLIPEELKLIQNKDEKDRTPEEIKLSEELIKKVNSEYSEFIQQKSSENVKFDLDDSFSEADFDEIIGINAGNEVVINGTTIKAEDLMDTFYTVFVNKN